MESLVPTRPSHHGRPSPVVTPLVLQTQVISADIINALVLGPQMSTSLFKVGKRPGQSLVATNVSGHSQGRLLYITDYNIGLNTAAEVIIIPLSNSE